MKIASEVVLWTLLCMCWTTKMWTAHYGCKGGKSWGYRGAVYVTMGTLFLSLLYYYAGLFSFFTEDVSALLCSPYSSQLCLSVLIPTVYWVGMWRCFHGEEKQEPGGFISTLASTFFTAYLGLILHAATR